MNHIGVIWCERHAAEGVLVEAGQAGDAEATIGDVQQPAQHGGGALVVREHDQVRALDGHHLGQRVEGGTRQRDPRLAVQHLERHPATALRRNGDVGDVGASDHEHAATAQGALEHALPDGDRDEDTDRRAQQRRQRQLQAVPVDGRHRDESGRRADERGHALT